MSRSATPLTVWPRSQSPAYESPHHLLRVPAPSRVPAPFPHPSRTLRTPSRLHLCWETRSRTFSRILPSYSLSNYMGGVVGKLCSISLRGYGLFPIQKPAKPQAGSYAGNMSGVRERPLLRVFPTLLIGVRPQSSASTYTNPQPLTLIDNMGDVCRNDTQGATPSVPVH